MSIHQFEHFGDDLAQTGIDPSQGLRQMAQRGMGVLNDFEAQVTPWR